MELYLLLVAVHFTLAPEAEQLMLVDQKIDERYILHVEHGNSITASYMKCANMPNCETIAIDPNDERRHLFLAKEKLEKKEKKDSPEKNGVVLITMDARQNTLEKSLEFKPKTKTKEIPTARSCNELKKQNPLLESGYYWMNLGKPTEVYCDMETDGGGWLMFGSIVVTDGSDVDQLDYRKAMSEDITKLMNVKNDSFLLTNSALKKLRMYTNFSQLRIYCTKNYHDRTFHIATSPNDGGKAVVDYFSLMSDKWCPPCKNSFEKMSDDNSFLANLCDKWDYGRGYWSGCAWLGDYNALRSLYNHVVYTMNYVVSIKSRRFACDDHWGHNGFNRNGIWRYYVR